MYTLLRRFAHMHPVAFLWALKWLVSLMLVWLPAVKFPVVIRPSGELTLLISLSFTLVSACLPLFLYVSVYFSSFTFFFFLLPYLFHSSLSQCASQICCMSAILILLKWCSLSSPCSTSLPFALIHFIQISVMSTHWCMQPFWCSNMLIGGIPSLIYGWGQHPFKLKLHYCCTDGVIGKYNRTHEVSSK